MSLRCPWCGTTSISNETGGYGGMIYRCKECTYRGSFIVQEGGSWDELGKPGRGDPVSRPVNDVNHEPGIPWWVKAMAIVFLLVIVLSMKNLF
ncbi:MAG: DUF3268 family zinc-finger domain-containing protein [Methanoregulaceae archaeon]|nr:DUF3268 family zinc-finger domain-containing protein [Methanoregulaceae archaeon]